MDWQPNALGSESETSAEGTAPTRFRSTTHRVGVGDCPVWTSVMGGAARVMGCGTGTAAWVANCLKTAAGGAHRKRIRVRFESPQSRILPLRAG